MSPEERDAQYVPVVTFPFLYLKTSFRKYKCPQIGCSHKTLQRSNMETHYIAKQYVPPTH
jgi:hypothetical protein